MSGHLHLKTEGPRRLQGMYNAREYVKHRWYGLLATGTVAVMGAIAQTAEMPLKHKATDAAIPGSLHEPVDGAIKGVSQSGVAQYLEAQHMNQIGLGAVLGVGVVSLAAHYQHAIDGAPQTAYGKSIKGRSLVAAGVVAGLVWGAGRLGWQFMPEHMPTEFPYLGHSDGPAPMLASALLAGGITVGVADNLAKAKLYEGPPKKPEVLTNDHVTRATAAYQNIPPQYGPAPGAPIAGPGHIPNPTAMPGAPGHTPFTPRSITY